MTLEEARAVAEICEDADGNCCVCVHGLADLLATAFPQFKWTYKEGVQGVIRNGIEEFSRNCIYVDNL